MPRCDDSGRILYQKPAALSFAERAGFPDKSISDFLPPEFSAKVNRLIGEGRTLVNENWLALGRILFADLPYRPITGVRQIFIVDETEHVEAVQQCRSCAGELEAMNRQIRDTRAELVQSEKMASLGNLAAGIAHEINSPLGAMSGNNQTGALAADKITRIIEERRTTFDDRHARDLERFVGVIKELNEANRTAISRIRKIVDSMRTFARLDLAEEDLFDIHAGMETTLTSLNHQIRRPTRVVRDFGDVPRVYCKLREINQVFMNLLSNAVQAMESPGVIHIKTRSQDGAVSIAISDTGTGIPHETLDKIFDPALTTQGARAGLGLGLPIAYRIVQDHGGSIAAKSEPGRGSTFTVTRPARRRRR